MIFGAAIKEDLISYKARDVEDWLFVQLIQLFILLTDSNLKEGVINNI